MGKAMDMSRYHDLIYKAICNSLSPLEREELDGMKEELEEAPAVVERGTQDGIRQVWGGDGTQGVREHGARLQRVGDPWGW